MLYEAMTLEASGESAPEGPHDMLYVRRWYWKKLETFPQSLHAMLYEAMTLEASGESVPEGPHGMFRVRASEEAGTRRGTFEPMCRCTTSERERPGTRSIPYGPEKTAHPRFAAAELNGRKFDLHLTGTTERILHFSFRIDRIQRKER
jgi:hypothetical protein